jgi:hypothetical protein
MVEAASRLMKKSDLEFIIFGVALLGMLLLATWLATR